MSCMTVFCARTYLLVDHIQDWNLFLRKLELFKNFSKLKHLEVLSSGILQEINQGLPRNSKLLVKTKKKAEFKWGPEEEKSFKAIIQALCNSLILQYLHFEKSLTITTDALAYAMEAILSQEKDGINLSIIYVSCISRTLIRLFYSRKIMSWCIICSKTVSALHLQREIHPDE